MVILVTTNFNKNLLDVDIKNIDLGKQATMKENCEVNGPQARIIDLVKFAMGPRHHSRQ